jgi:integral membrane protein (TIGR00529 family)
MDFIATWPAVVRILAIFVLILIAIKRQFSLGSAFLLGALMLGLIFGLDLKAILRSFLLAIIHPKTLSLSVVVSLILALSHSMEVTGQMERLLEKFRGLIRQPSLNLITFPALIGLLPMPGGAIFSAPMVKSLGSRQKMTEAQLSYVNYWFRHIWEYWWPLYPGVLLATALAGINLWYFVILLIPLTVVALALGYWPIRKAMPWRTNTKATGCQRRPSLTPFLRELSPILMVIMIGLGLGFFLTLILEPFGIQIAKELGLIVALLMAICWVWHNNELPVKRRLGILFRPQLLQMVYMVTSILIFKGILEDSQAVANVSQEFLNWRIPLVSITIILPFIVGGVSGITIAFVGTTFPILISIAEAVGESRLIVQYMMLAMASGFAGVLLSPLHLCLLLSNKYFNAPLESVYKYLWMPSVGLILAGGAYFTLLRVLVTS